MCSACVALPDGGIMNYAHYQAWVLDRVEELVDFGIPRRDAEEIMHFVEIVGINAETTVRKQEQLLLNFEQMGSKMLGKSLGISDRAVRDRRTRILQKRGSEIGRPCVDAASA